MIFTGVTAWLICMLYMVSASGSPRHPQPPHPQPSLAAATGSPPSTRHEHAAAPVCPQVAYFMEGLQRTLLGLVEVVLNGLWVVFWLSAAASFAAEPLCKPSSECRGRPAAGHSHRLAATGLAQHGAPYAACWGGVCGGWVGHGGRGGGGAAPPPPRGGAPPPVAGCPSCRSPAAPITGAHPGCACTSHPAVRALYDFGNCSTFLAVSVWPRHGP